MKIVNRCAVTIAPRQPFIDWAQRQHPDQPLPPGGFEPGLYLLPAYDTREEAIELLAQGYEEISRAAWPCFRSGLPFSSLTWSVTRARNHWPTTR